MNTCKDRSMRENRQNRASFATRVIVAEESVGDRGAAKLAGVCAR
jgi:hypothetical protein